MNVLQQIVAASKPLVKIWMVLILVNATLAMKGMVILVKVTA